MKAGLIPLLLVLTASAETYFSTHVRKDHCNPGLLASYNLEVIRKPTNDTNFICPGIDLNCCTIDSQLQIFKRWVQGGERARLLQVYKTFIATYAILFDDFKLIEKMAELILAQLGPDQLSNCGEMAKAVLNVRASALKEQVLTLIKRAYRFIYDSRRGFYCSLCDAEAHENYNTMDGAIHTSFGFCSSLVKETIGWTTFRYEHFPKISRLYSHFLSTCDIKGKYDGKGVIKDDLKLFINRKFTRQIRKCSTNINDASAVGLCFDYCKHFNPAKFSRLFEGEFERLLAYRTWTNEKLAVVYQDKESPNSKTDLVIGRLLQDVKESVSPFDAFNSKYGTQVISPITYSAKEDFEATTAALHFDDSIFRTGKDKVYSVAELRIIESTSGINFLNYGYMFKMDKETLEKLDVQVDLKADERYRNATDVLSVNFGYRNSSVQIIS